LDHCICYHSLQASAVYVDEDERDYDHLPLYFDISVTSDVYSNQPSLSHKGFEKRDWSSANMPLYLTRLGALQSTVRVPFHLLCTNVYPIIDNASADLNRYYRDIILCIKQAEGVAVPLIRFRRNTQKPIWKCDPLLKKSQK